MRSGSQNLQSIQTNRSLSAEIYIRRIFLPPTEYLNVPIAIPQTYCRLKGRSRVQLWHPFHRAPFPMHAQLVPGDVKRMHSVLNTLSQAPVGGEEKKGRLRESIVGQFLCAFLCFISLADVSLRSNRERSVKNDPTQYLSTVELMVENDNPVPSYLSDVFSKPNG